MALITHLLGAFAFMPDAGRVAPIRACVSCSAFQAAACKRGSEVRKKLLREKEKTITGDRNYCLIDR